MTIYLYLKIHRKTSLRYLGKTTKDPFTYNGSGLDWIDHLSSHGSDIDTIVLKTCESNEELNYWGRYYSDKWRVTESVDDFGNRIYANRIPETGGGGTPTDDTKNILRKQQTDRVDDGSHHLLSGEIQGKASRERVSNGTHNLLGPDENERRIREGTHNFVGMIGEKHHKFDPTLFSFRNTKTNITITMTSNEFLRTVLTSVGNTPLLSDRCNLSKVIHGHKKTIRGWQLATSK